MVRMNCRSVMKASRAQQRESLAASKAPEDETAPAAEDDAPVLPLPSPPTAQSPVRGIDWAIHVL